MANTNPHHLTRNVIVAVDKSDASAAAFQFAAKMFGKQPDVLIHLVHCFEPLESVFTEEFTYVPSEKDKAKHVEKHMAELEQFAAENVQDVVCKTHLLTGDPRYVLCEVANAWDAEVVVVGSSGKGLVKRALLGSVSTYLVHHCEKPVTVIRA